MEEPPKFSSDMSLEERQKKFLEMPDEDIDYSDIPPLDEEFFKNAKQVNKPHINFSRKVIIYTLGHLYQEGKISGGLVAQILDCDLATAYTILSEYGFPVIDYDPDEWELEVQTSQEI